MIAALLAAEPSGGAVPDYTLPLVSVITAVIAAVALVIVRKARGPVTIQELWDENRKRAAETARLDRGLRVVANGFDAVTGYVERTMGTRQNRPPFTPHETDAIKRARDWLDGPESEDPAK